MQIDILDSCYLIHLQMQQQILKFQKLRECVYVRGLIGTEHYLIFILVCYQLYLLLTLHKTYFTRITPLTPVENK